MSILEGYLFGHGQLAKVHTTEYNDFPFPNTLSMVSQSWWVFPFLYPICYGKTTGTILCTSCTGNNSGIITTLLDGNGHVIFRGQHYYSTLPHHLISKFFVLHLLLCSMSYERGSIYFLFRARHTLVT